MAKAATAAQKNRFDLICSAGCIICGGVPQIHYLVMGDHDKTIPLCWLHGNKKSFDELLEKTNNRLSAGD